jgi:hypothetical protein
MHGSRSKIPSKKSRPYIYDVKFLALLGTPYIYDISRLRVKPLYHYIRKHTAALTCNVIIIMTSSITRHVKF